MRRMTKFINRLLIASIGIGYWSCGPTLPEEVKAKLATLPDYIDYNFHIKPILSDRCFSCHGPDEEAREADLRLDDPQVAKSRREDGHFAIREGNISKSALVERILSSDPEYMMPPPSSKLTLNDQEKALLITWIDQGAEYKEHWAFIPPVKPKLPEISQSLQEWSKNEIDYFIASRLEQEGLLPNNPAQKELLMRRLYFDLTGLPPEVADIDRFLADESEAAVEVLIDTLMQSPAYAERLTMEWLDIARYADSHGLHADGWRNMWPWRDWVIRAFQNNMSYDQFVTEQLAGDLLPEAGKQQILATAFHRNHPMTAEGGAIDEEFRLEYVADRTNTTATAFMGLTMECARCHDHKFDPISQREYYQLSAFFNNVHELGMTGDDGNYGPLLKLTGPETEKAISTLNQEIALLDKQIEQQSENISEIKDYLNRQVDLSDGLLAYYPLERLQAKNKDEEDLSMIDGDQKCTTTGNPKITLGKVGNALEFSSGGYDHLQIEGIGNFDVHQPFSAALWINTTKKQIGKTQVLVGNAGDKNNFWRGWDFYLDDKNRLSFRLIHALPHNYLHIRSVDSIPLHQWTHVAFTYDGTGHLSNTHIYIDGERAETKVLYERLYKNTRTIGSGAQLEIDRALRVGKSYRSFTGDNGIFLGSMDELRIYHKPLSPLEVSQMVGSEQSLSEVDAKIHAISHHPDIQTLGEERAKLLAKKIAIQDTIAEVMVMEEMEQPRPTFLLNRGQYDNPLEQVQPSTPQEILSFPEDLPRNRLGLAKWLFDPSHPLTARATVNRYWQMIFGQGLVKTARDFGSQGALPSHPELLDWLAIYLQENNWDLRKLLKLMVMSATYQQSSVPQEQHIVADPENLLLARGVTYRYPAEIIRDNALAVSGLLVRKVGGPSVKPYQPEGLWIEKGTFSHKLLRYEVGSGPDLYRRSLYTFIKRTSPHPVMTVFDAPNRDVCTITRESTNTPLQALVLMNDPQFVEASRALAVRMQREASQLEDQLMLAFRLVTSRKPSTSELSVLHSTYQRESQAFENDIDAAQELLQVGEYPHPTDLPVAKTAALTIVANTLLCHDDAFTKR